MATQWSPSEHPPGIRNERNAQSLQRSLTRLPVSARVSKHKGQVDYALPSAPNKPVIADIRPVLKNDDLRSRTTNASTTKTKKVEVLPSVTQAQSPPETAQNNPSGAPLPKRRLYYPSPSSTKTPSLISGSTTSTRDSSGSALRRKPTTINQYALRVKTDPDSMQHHRDLVETAHRVHSDDDPFPGAIFGMTLPSTSGFMGSKASMPTAAVNERLSNPKDFESSHRPTLELAVPFTDATSSRHSESPFSYQSTSTSASSFSSFAASSIGSNRRGESGDPPISVEKTNTLVTHPSMLPTSSQQRGGVRFHATLGRSSQRDIPAKQESPRSKTSHLSKPSSRRHKSNQPSVPAASTTLLPRGTSYTGVAPEFAHLNEPVSGTTFMRSRGAQPRRPSRDGVTGLVGLTSDSPVVESNISPMAFSRNRTPSLGSPEPSASSSPANTRRAFGFSSRSSSRQSVQSPSGASLPTTPGPPDPSLGRIDSPMVGLSPSMNMATKMNVIPKPPREGLQRPEKAEKSRRGPAAGTGHEGYGKFGLRGRGSSIFGGKLSRSSSKESSTSRKGLSFLGRRKSASSDTEEETDWFFKQRQDPVILRGTGSLPDTSARDHVTTLHDKIERPATAPFEHPPFPGASQTTIDEPRRPGSSKRPSLSEIGREGREGHWLSTGHSQDSKTPSPPKNPTLFQRVKSKISNQNFTDAPLISEIIPALQRPPPSAPVANFNKSKQIGDDDITRLVGGDHQSPKISTAPAAKIGGSSPPVPYESRHEGLLPSPPLLQDQPRPPKTPVLLKARTATSTKAPQPIDLSAGLRPKVLENRSTTRLRPVGRIPQVVKTEDRPGFAMPFAGPKARCGSEPLYAPSLDHDNNQSPKTTIKRKPIADPIEERRSTRDFHGADSTSHFAETLAACGQDFLSFPPRKNSELSYTSSSGLGSPCIRRSLICGEDEVWNEYDTLIDEVMPHKGCVSTSSSLGNPFQYADMVENESGFTATGNQSTPANLDLGTHPEHLDNDMSRPSTTFSISDYLLDSDDEKTKTSSAPNRSARTSQADTLLDKRRSGLSTSRSKMLSGYHDGFSGSTVLDQIDKQSAFTGPSSASAELRFAALMTSKWLSFGRLLFSPAHEEAKSGDDTRILIIDGLGKEWSYHCALTYPKCQFYNLSPEPASSSWETLSNHHHIPHPTISTPFPFPRGFFSAVVFRFPTATSDSAYQACFHEIKRTLRPSGYLETSVVDLDLVKMGNKARKAVRDLKIRMHGADCQTSLWNHGDAFLTLLGRREFENIQRCVVGIPVAGRIRRSQDSSSSGSGAETRNPKAGTHEPEPEYLSFTQWMQGKGTAEGHENNHHYDEDITKTVAKIGRWWYSSCYPDPAKGSSLWETPGLLHECECQGTSFRLLFCYAQKPMCVVRRTASV